MPRVLSASSGYDLVRLAFLLAAGLLSCFSRQAAQPQKFETERWWDATILKEHGPTRPSENRKREGIPG
jgi:hypothetical protein